MPQGTLWNLLDGQVEIQHDVGHVEIRQIAGCAEVSEDIVGVGQNEDYKVGQVAEDSGDGEACGRGLRDGSRGAAPVEAAQIDGAVRFEFMDCFGAHRLKLWYGNARIYSLDAPRKSRMSGLLQLRP
jgi:hypothetical protein